MTDPSPYAPPKSELIDRDALGISAHRRYAIFEADAKWPSRCYKCNAAADGRKKFRLSYVNPWIYLSLLITPIVTIILALIFQKRFTLQLPVCERHLRRRRNFLIFQWTLVALTVAVIAVGIIADLDQAFLIAMLMFLLIVISALAGRIAYIAKFKRGKLWLRGPGKDFLRSLPAFVG